MKGEKRRTTDGTLTSHEDKVKNHLTEGRVVPRENDVWDTEEQYVLYLRHLAAYDFAKSFVGGKSVLEIGCGSGYGANFLAGYASSVTAVDISETTVKYCEEKYNQDNLSFKRVNEQRLPFKDASFDICISFQVIEHIEPNKVRNWLTEVRRVLKDNGIFIVTTPNKKLRSLLHRKPSKHHQKEYEYGEFKKFLESVFSDVEILGLRGTDEVQSIEVGRVKQNPLKVYILLPLWSFMPDFIRCKWKNFRTRGMERQHFIDTERHNVGDFKIGRKYLKECLDLVGICNKRGN